jgi:hypothetical protein
MPVIHGPIYAEVQPVDKLAPLAKSGQGDRAKLTPP